MRQRGRALVLAAALLASGSALAQTAAPASAITVVPQRVHTPGDPWEGLNRKLFKFSTGIDKGFFRPLALGIGKVVPKPARDGLRNFFRNLSEPIVFLNSVLQLRFKPAGRAFKRFFINSVLGVGGLFDVAGKDGLPHQKNGFGNTLARYGVKPGPYLFIPLVGPTTLRDLFGGQADAAVLPLAVGSPFNRLDYQIGKTVITAIDQRIELDAQYGALTAGAADPYATFRSLYLQNRAAEVAEVKGKTDTPEPTPLDDPLTDPGADQTTPQQQQPDTPAGGGEDRLDLAGDCYV